MHSYKCAIMILSLMLMPLRAIEMCHRGLYSKLSIPLCGLLEGFLSIQQRELTLDAFSMDIPSGISMGNMEA